MGNDITGPLNCSNALAPVANCNFLISNANISGTTIVGTVVIDECDPCIKVASGALVSIYRGTTLIDTVRANGCGNFVFTNLTAGSYIVVASKKGLISGSKRILVADNNIYMLNLLLKRDCSKKIK